MFDHAVLYVLVSVVVILVISLILREVVCWYWKINNIVALLTEILDILRKEPQREDRDENDINLQEKNLSKRIPPSIR